MEKQERARQAILGWIDAGRYAPGARLPSLVEMGRLLGLKSQPVRKAVEALAREGRVYTVNGKGTYVARPDRTRPVFVLAQSPGALWRDRDELGWFISTELHEGLVAALEARGLRHALCFRSEFETRPDDLAQRVLDEEGLGLVTLSSRTDGLLRRVLERLGPHRVVSVEYGGPPSHLNEVKVRFAPGLRALLDKAWDLGHRRIAYLYARNIADAVGHMERYRVVLEFLGDKGVALDPRAHIKTAGTAMDGYRATMRLLDEAPEVTLIVAATDDHAVGVLQALRDRGLTPGRDVSVLGFDDMPDAAELGLATVRTPRARIADAAVALLERTAKERLTGERVWLDSEPVFRDSLGPAPEPA